MGRTWEIEYDDRRWGVGKTSKKRETKIKIETSMRKPKREK